MEFRLFLLTNACVPESALLTRIEEQLEARKALLEMRVSNNVQSGGHRVARKKAVEDRNPSNCSEFAWSPR